MSERYDDFIRFRAILHWIIEIDHNFTLRL